MPLSFPSSPSVGQQSTQNGRVYQWSGTAWELITLNTVTVSSSAPSGGSNGDVWFQTSGSGQVTPTTLSASANDYAPGDGDIYRLSSSAAVNITGWVSWTDTTLKLLVNVGSFAITLKHQSTSSSASNRFITPTAGDYIIPAGSSAVIYWDATDSRVRVL